MPRELLGRFSNRLDVYDIFGPEGEAYIILGADNQVIKNGNLDEMGRTERLSSDNPDVLQIIVGNLTIKFKENI